ncbi:MAG: choice-of-anchor X domain-containing protein [Lysobacterales bacterium]
MKQNRLAATASLLLLAAAPIATPDAAPVAKQLAGPPSEFASMAAANPIGAAIHSKSALLPISLEKSVGGGFSWQASIPVESDNLRFVVLSGNAKSAWNLSLQDPASKRVHKAADLAIEKRAADYGMAEARVPAEFYSFSNIPRGDWKVKVEGASAGRGFLLVEGGGSERLMSHQAAFNQLLGERIGLVASVYDLEKSADVENANALSEAWLRVTAPDGQLRQSPMFDDGLHQDGIANDGVFGADFLADQAGDFNAQVVVRGRDAAGSSFLRSAEHLIPVIDRKLQLAAVGVQAKSVGDERIELRLAVNAAKAAGSHYRVYAEVWGQDSNQKSIPVAWIGGMSDLGKSGLTLGLDRRWIALAGASAPFELRNVRIEDPDHFIALAKAERLPLDLGSAGKVAANRGVSIDDSMRMGPRPAELISSKGVGSKLLLVHGYCSSDVWGGVAGQFSNAAVFRDLNKNRSHDAFARLIQTFGNTWNSYGIVAHSQGGAAALHLYNYYWSGLDNAGAGRLIQSVGTPYRGTSLAGNLAALGSIFGVGCGSNTDLTYSGAASWLAGIASWARAKTNFHTTSFKDRSFVYDYCHLGSDLLLSDPDDGTTEKTYGQLSGGVNLGHKTGWCHTSGMRDPAQTTDSSRNSNMSANAAR